MAFFARANSGTRRFARLSSGQVLDDSSLVLIYVSLGILVIAGVIFFATR